MRVRLLGPVELADATGTPVEIAAPKRRAVLAVLALELNHVVPVDRLLDLVWDGNPPPRARTALQGHISALRRYGLEVATRDPGYVLLSIADEDEDVDLHHFRGLVARARTADDRSAAELLGRALALWRGTPLADLPSAALREEVASRIVQDRLAALEGWAERKVRLTEGGDAVAALSEAVRTEPFREPLIRLLVLALHQADRQRDALDLFHRTRELLAAELGVSPGPPLRAAYETVLRGTEAQPQPQPVATTAPAQLPRESTGFVGRGSELAALDNAADGSGIALIVGAAGVGKTALALRWAHHSAAAFPDGQLFADLRGFSAGAPVSTASVLAGFLRALGPADRTIPADPDERIALYRSLLADRRVLVVLDNVRAVGDVLPLLPSGPGCATVVTTRNLLGGLVAREGAAVLRVEALPAQESHALLARTVGRDRIAAETEAAAELVRLCEGLPLALRVAGARLAMRPGRPVSELVADLSDEQARLSVLTTDDADSGVEAALRLSYRVLPGPAAALFRFLGLHQGADIDTWTAAALSGQSLAQAGRSLADLASAHLLQEASTGPGRFARHDLVRLYTVRLAGQDLPAEDRAEAYDRLLDYYLAVTATAAESVVSRRQLLYWPAAHPAAGIPPVADNTGWFRTEAPAIQALVTACAEGRAAGRAWRLASNTMPMYFRTERVDDWVTASLTGLRAAESSGEAAGRSRLHTDVGMALCERSDFAEAMPYLRRAVGLAEESGSDEIRYLAVSRLAIGQLETGDESREQSIDTLKDALGLARDLDDLPSQAAVLNNLGHVLNLLGRHAEALEFGDQARLLTAAMPSSHTHLASLATTAECLHALGRPTEAIGYARQAVELSRRYGNPAYEALALRLIGQIQRDLGQDAESAASLRESLGVLAPLGDRTEADAVAALLDEGSEGRDDADGQATR